MGICEVLTIVFIVLKLVGVITWSWWLVLLPEIIAIALYIVLVLLQVFLIFLDR
jgi:hypothetical protein